MAHANAQSSDMKLAVIETGGKQYTVRPGQTISVEKLPGKNIGDAVSFDKVLLVENEAGTTLGSPYVDGAAVEGELVEAGKGKKTLVIKFKNKIRYFKKYGHRQPYAKVKIQ